MLTVEIREEDCVGCSRCIQVCPVDAIVGANKLMHSVLTDECIGCKLCLTPCPTDCIEVLPLEEKLKKIGTNISINKLERAKKSKIRYRNRSERIAREAQTMLPDYSNDVERKSIIKDNIAAAIKRVKNKVKDS